MMMTDEGLREQRRGEEVGLRGEVQGWLSGRVRRRCAGAGGVVERVRGLRVRQVLRDSTIDALAGSRSRALRLIRDSWCLGGLMMESRALRADIRAHFWREKIRLTVEK